MFCMQCEQTEGGSGCSTVGVCGKTPEVAHIQDALVHLIKGVGVCLHAARTAGVAYDKQIDRDVLAATFATLTNVNFDAEAFAGPAGFAAKMLAHRNTLMAALKAAGKAPTAEIVNWAPTGLDRASLEASGVTVGVRERRDVAGPEALALQELIMYGIKGVAAYADHALIAGVEDDSVYAGIASALDVIGRGETEAGVLLKTALGVGATNVATMAALDKAHKDKFGTPSPAEYSLAPRPGKCILISGHDLVDLEQILQQTEGTGINVYTHGEMLPAHGYPKLKAYKHLAGHWGSAWQLQRMEYAAFPGPIVQSTNCIMEPRPGYKSRLFTTNSTGWPGVAHIATGPGGKKDFSAVIKSAQECAGFAPGAKPMAVGAHKAAGTTGVTGFGHDAVLGAAPALLEAVSKGNLERLVLIGGCDGSESERSYYTKLATSLPDTAAILTLGCGKYRVLGKKDYGNIKGTGIPRVVDMGQCNDSYSAAVVALKLAEVLKVGVNELPLSIVLSWLEQKAVAVLLSLLHLGVKNIRIGPSLPAFITPAALDILVKNFNLQPIKADAEDGDVAAVMGKASA